MGLSGIPKPVGRAGLVVSACLRGMWTRRIPMVSELSARPPADFTSVLPHLWTSLGRRWGMPSLPRVAARVFPITFFVLFEGALRRAMHQLKYQGEIGLGDSLAALMIPFVEKLDWEVELLVPVPLGKKRKEERGYNQVGLLARPLSLAMGWKYRPRALSRTRETRSQVGLSAEERRENMRDAFTARVKSVQGRRVLVMDDVATTGATLDSCARALLEAGAREVYALTLARALPHHGLTVA